MKAVISLSGGLDSTCLLMYLLANGYDEIRAFSFNYGQKHDIELKKVQKNIKFLQEKGFNVAHQIIDVRDCFSDSASSLHKGGEAIPEGHYAEENMKSTVVENRNIIFSSIIYGKALGWANKTQSDVKITLGLHAGDHCFTADTTIFTPNGYKTVGELKVGDEVYSFDGENLKTEITKLQDIIHKGTNSTIYEIATSTGKVKLTSEHKVYVCEMENYNSKFGFEKRFSSKLVKDLKVGDKLITPFLQTSTEDADVTIDVLPILEKCLRDDANKYNGYSAHVEGDRIDITCPNGRSTSAISRYVSAYKLFELLAWYITEGWSSNRYIVNKSASRFASSFSQSADVNFENADSIEECIKYFGNGIAHSSKVLENGIPKETTYTFSSVLSVLMSNCGYQSCDKHIPSWLMDLLVSNPGTIRDFVYTIVCGDGYYNKVSGMWSYTTNSEQLMKDMSFLIKLLGLFVKVTYTDNNCYVLTFGNKNRKQGLVKFGESALTSISSINVIEYDEPVDVYDLSVEKNHNFFAGDNGNILISNSIYPDCRPASQKMARELFAISNWGSERVDYIAPFVNIDKGAVLASGIAAMQHLGFTESEREEVLCNTHTCYNPTPCGDGGDEVKSCGKCGSCSERLESFAINGLKDPIPYQE